LFWRLYLRAIRQDGSTGQPIILPVFSRSSRTLAPPPKGYFVDFTALAAAHGWRRIAAQERESFNWRSELLAQEYWHFERRDGLSWYGAVRLIHDDKTIARLFSVEALKDAGARAVYSTARAAVGTAADCDAWAMGAAAPIGIAKGIDARNC